MGRGLQMRIERKERRMYLQKIRERKACPQAKGSLSLLACPYDTDLGFGLHWFGLLGLGCLD
jgi:hypothetical protein